MTTKKQAEDNARGCGCLIVLVVIIAAIVAYGVNQPDSPDEIIPSPVTDIFTATPYPLQGDYLEIPNVLDAMVSPAQTETGWNIYSEVIVVPGANNEVTASALMQAAMARYGAFLDFSVILDDCTEAIDYTFDNESDMWRLTTLTATACEQTGINAQHLNAPVIVTSMPNLASSVTATVRPTTDPRPAKPGNCSTAVAMGISAEQAAQWQHLDRDGDGVACYGD